MNSELKMLGTITKAMGFNFFEVVLDNGHKLICKPCGKIISITRIRLNAGDKVRVRLSEFDLTKGVIEWRFR